MKAIREFNVKNKKVLVRCDFNVPLDEKGNILNDFRIKASLPTIKYLIKNKAKVILMSHLGDPQGPDEKYSLKPVAEKLEELLRQEVEFVKGAIPGVKLAGELVLLENLRFHKGEKANDENFAKQLASLADIYINNAFGVCHRNHASVVGVPKYLPSAAGLLLEKEIKILSQAIEKPDRPLVAIIGGVKIETKKKVIDAFLKKADFLLIGGKIAFDSSLQCPVARQRDIGGQRDIEGDIGLQCNEVGLRHIGKMVLPIDNKEKLDIGPKSIKDFSKIIKGRRTIIWNGPLGKFEDKRFEEGTKKIAQAIAKNKKAFKIAGGGETIEAIFKYGLEKKFDHISTGGGAMLAFFSGEKLPGIEALK